MEIIIDEELDRVELWVSRGTNDELVDDIARICTASDREVVIYRSGNGDLVSLTQQLLAQNKDL